MSANTSAFSPKEFTVGIAEETTVGTAPSTFIGIEVESISLPAINDLRIIEQRAGSQGRIVNTGDLLRHEAGAVHEFSVSGVLTSELLPILMENATGVEHASNVVKVLYNHAPVSFLHGATSSGSHNTVAFHIKGVSAFNSSYTLKGCIITSLTLNANSSENGGRFTFDLTAQTRSPFSSSASSASTVNAYSTNFRYLSHFTDDKMVNDTDVILDSVGLTIENPAIFLGNKVSGSDYGLPEAYQRSIPDFKVMANCVVKYDTNTIDFLDNWRTQTVPAQGLYLADHATWGSADTFGINLAKSFISEQPSFQEDDYLKVNVIMQGVSDSSSNSLLEVIVA